MFAIFKLYSNQSKVFSFLMASPIKDNKEKIHRVINSDEDNVYLFKIIRDISNLICLLQDINISNFMLHSSQLIVLFILYNGFQ